MYVPTPGAMNVLFVITDIIEVSAGSATIGWQSAPGRSYRLQYVDNITDTNWAPLGVITATTTATSFMDTNTAGVPRRYYRLFEIE